MKASNTQWAEQLAGKMPEDLSREIDIFETEIDPAQTGEARRAPFRGNAPAPGNLWPALR